MSSSSSRFGDLFDNFSGEAFRLETLDDYTKSSNPESLRAFLAGEPQPEDYNQEWCDFLGAATGAGKRIYRVHILSRPLTPYLRFELGWGYRKNSTAGEEFFILDTTEKPNPLEDVPDFWLFSEAVPFVLGYDETGEVIRREVLSEERAPEFIRYRDIAMKHAVPFAEWWEQHGGM
ncbi:DUF6879 family protein [Kitasatospora sp. NPDC085895]|uniref:DUF6879 family protein n=1 Tax=Kitasatospora sp. NPDC085895 TaxID=3155057 RepID=UPI00344CF0C6